MDKKIFEAIRSGNAAFEQLKEMERDGIPSSDAMYREVKKIADRGNEAGNTLVQENEWVVREIVNQIYRAESLRKDLMQAGRMALLAAANSYEPGHNTKFSTYAWKSVYRDVKRELPGNLFVLKLSEGMMDDIHRVERVKEEIERVRESEATIKEIAVAAKLSEKKADQILKTAAIVKFSNSIDDNDGEDSGRPSLRDTLAGSESCEPEYQILRADSRETVRAAVMSLSDKDREVICWLYGFYDGETHSMADVAGRVGCSKGTVCKINKIVCEMLSANEALQDCYYAA